MDFVMSEFCLNPDDVVSMDEPAASLIAQDPTFRIDQLQKTFRQLLGNSSVTQSWIEDGANCQILSASTGKGWKKGKIRIRFEFVPDEPEPSPDASFLDSLRTDDNPEEQDARDVE
jgi:hypothetical protein